MDVAWAACSPLLMTKFDVKTKVTAEKAIIITIDLEVLRANLF